MTDSTRDAAGCAVESASTEDQNECGSDDTRLLAHARAGDEGACEALVRRHGGGMLSVARRYLRTEEDSADAVQDAFHSAFRSLDGFEGNSALGTWLHRIVVNVCLMRLGAQSRSREVRIDALLPTFDETGHHSCPVRPWDDRVLALLTQDETRAHVRACIDRLLDPYRELLVLRDLEELDTEQTAQQLGINAGTVKARLHRARQALRTMLEPIMFGEERDYEQPPGSESGAPSPGTQGF